MPCKLIIAKDAKADMDHILSYMIHELKNPDAAKAFHNDVKAAYRHIAQNPWMFALCENGLLQRNGYRKIVIKNHILVYRYTEETNTAVVLRAFYGRMDYLRCM